MSRTPAHLEHKYKIFAGLVVVILAFGIVAPALAAYLGPNRTVTGTTSICKVVLYECKYVAAKNSWRYKAVDNWSCGDESKPWQGYPSDPSSQGCFDATAGDTYWSKEETLEETSVTYPPAVTTGTLQNCNEFNGWCNTAPQLFLDATEPLSGYSILALEGSRNAEPFACSGSNCSIPLNEGVNNFTYWALSSWGDSSEMGAFTAKVDTIVPEAGLNITASRGTNGWYTSPTSITAVGSDSTSGLQSVLLSVNHGTWQSSTLLTDGVYNVDVQAMDNAGNVSDHTTLILVDTTTPSINLSANGISGNSGWYISDLRINTTASDATSGIASFEMATDGSTWIPVSAPVLFTGGIHTLQLKAVDKAGNRTETPVQEFHIDTVAPMVEMPKTWDLGKTVTYDVWDDISGLTSVRVVIEDEDEKFAKVVWDEEISSEKFTGEIAWNGKFRDGTIAPPGEYLVWVKAGDAAGNERFKLGTVNVPSPHSFFQLVPTAVSPDVMRLPPEILTSKARLLDPSIVISGFGNTTDNTTSTVTQVLNFPSLGTTTASTSTASNSGILWGAAAIAMAGAVTAYVLEERRKREEEMAKQALEQAQSEERRKKIKARKMAKLEAQWAQEAAWEQARLERERMELRNAGMESKMTRLEAEENARWEAAQQAQKNKTAVLPGTGLQAYYQSEKEGAPVTAPMDGQKSWWEKVTSFVQEKIVQPVQMYTPKIMDWVDKNQVITSIGVGALVGLGALAIISTGGLATPLVIGGAALLAGGLVAGGTVALNNYYDRPWYTNIVKNVVSGAVTAAAIPFIATGGLTTALIKAGNGITALCMSNPAACAKADVALNAFDKLEEASLIVKGAYQTWTGNSAGAAETSNELRMEYLDGGVPGNVVALELGEKLAELGDDVPELIAAYGDDIVPLLLQYGDDAVDIIGAYGDEGITLLMKFGDDTDEVIGLVKKYGTPAVKLLDIVDRESADNLLKTLDKDVLDYAIKQGPDAVYALSRWSFKELKEFGPELALRAKNDAKVIEAVKRLVGLGPIDPKHLTSEQEALIKIIAENSTQYGDEGQIVLGKWVDYGNGFTDYARETGSAHYNPHPDMWNLMEKLGKENRNETAWLVNKQVIQTGIDKGLPFEYSLNGLPSGKIDLEEYAIEKIWEGGASREIIYANIEDALGDGYTPIRLKELVELYYAGYVYSFDSIANSYVLIKP